MGFVDGGGRESEAEKGRPSAEDTRRVRSVEAVGGADEEGKTKEVMATVEREKVSNGLSDSAPSPGLDGSGEGRRKMLTTPLLAPKATTSPSGDGVRAMASIGDDELVVS
jgi:hypothetical protein